MSHFLLRLSAIFLAVTMASIPACHAGDGRSAPFPSPNFDDPIAKVKSTQRAVVAGGCFWGIQAVFKHVKGVVSATSGYAGGAANTAHRMTPAGRFQFHR